MSLEKQIEKARKLEKEAIRLMRAAEQEESPEAEEMKKRAEVISAQVFNARVRAIHLACDMYNLDITELVEFPRILKYPGAIGGLLGERGSFLSESAFQSSGWLGASILQVIILSRMRKINAFPDDPQQYHLDLLAALDSALAKADEFGLSNQEKSRLEKTRKWHFRKIAFKYRKQVTEDKNYHVAEKTGDLEKLSLPDALYGRLVSIQVTEGGKGSGEIFKLRIRRLTGRGLEIEIPFGTVFFPPNKNEQPRTIFTPTTIDLKGNNEVEVEIEGVCLDPRKTIPEKGLIVTGYNVWNLKEMDDNSYDPVFKENIKELGPEKFEEYLRAVEIVKKGYNMEKAGQFKGFLGKNHALVIIQRAVWVEATKNEAIPQSRETLEKEIEEQYRALGKEVSRKEIESITDRIWEEISRLLERAERPEKDTELIDILKQKIDEKGK
ncbi:MAG: hypothetical protein J7M18_02710 [Candidatus Eremiobacteraeota bacterium]|nr:hypothetical protein [Candidatus Eremiobacteraeota bacterium]